MIIYIYVCVFACVFVCMYTYVICIYVCVCVCIYVYIYIYIILCNKGNFWGLFPEYLHKKMYIIFIDDMGDVIFKA